MQYATLFALIRATERTNPVKNVNAENNDIDRNRMETGKSSEKFKTDIPLYRYNLSKRKKKVKRAPEGYEENSVN
jgi:hypothetical protein